jgi:hypothetical protein
MVEPRSYPEWRKDQSGRWRDAFHAFGHLWFSHARENALRTIPASASKEARALAVEAVDAALYNTMMIFDGIVAARPDATHTVGFSLIAQVWEAGLTGRSPHVWVSIFGRRAIFVHRFFDFARRRHLSRVPTSRSGEVVGNGSLG